MAKCLPGKERVVKVAVTQMACCVDKEKNASKAVELVREAASQGANIVLLQEIFHTLYFCQEQNADNFKLATTEEESPLIATFSTLAKELEVVIPLSFFERHNNAYYNSVVVIDSNGQNLGKYRKAHIPDGPGYQEKFYFTPGDSGFKVFDTSFGRLGVGICWDQWYPEAARAMALQGAEIIVYPTAIGSEPHNPGYDSFEHWQRTIVGHAAANMVPVVVANRVGTEATTVQNMSGSDSNKEWFTSGSCVNFYGSSFITDNVGKVLTQMDRESDGVSIASLPLSSYQHNRTSWGLYRDRRPELYQALLTMDGQTAIKNY